MKTLSVKNFNEIFLDVFLIKYNLLKKKKKIYIYTFFCLSFTMKSLRTLTLFWVNSVNSLLMYLFLVILKLKTNFIYLPIKEDQSSQSVSKINFLNPWTFFDYLNLYYYYYTSFIQFNYTTNGLQLYKLKNYNAFYFFSLKLFRYSLNVLDFNSLTLSLYFYKQSLFKKEQLLNYYISFWHLK